MAVDRYNATATMESQQYSDPALEAEPLVGSPKPDAYSEVVSGKPAPSNAEIIELASKIAEQVLGPRPEPTNK